MFNHMRTYSENVVKSGPVLSEIIGLERPLNDSLVFSGLQAAHSATL